jgi:predicted regulator of Ras-like GTPase activity (Roadblock/LC7/MglB family)
MTKGETRIMEAPIPVIIEEPVNAEKEETFQKLKAILAQIRKKEGVIGFILKNNVQAVFDVEDIGKLQELSILSSELFSFAEKMLSLCKEKTTKRIMLDGVKMKILGLNIDENYLCVFMDKNVDSDEILRLLLS